MYNRRWYDRYIDASETIDMLKNLEEAQQKVIANDVIDIANSIKSYHKEKESVPLSIGLERVLGLYNRGKSRRWYDKTPELNKALLNISTLPEQDYVNIMEGLHSALR